DLALRILPSSYSYVINNPKTLLPLIVGIYSIQTFQGLEIPFFVMNNIFATKRIIHERYDLKGSWVNRKSRHSSIQSSSGHASLQLDLDMKDDIKIGKEISEKIINQLNEDVKFLSKVQIMDYSLLVGVH